jgi:Arc/MetJ-type ribon-helix-helix transcriptional regulator
MKEEDKQAILEFQANRCRSCRNSISSTDQANFVQNLSRREGGKGGDPANHRALCKKCKPDKVTVTFTLSQWENNLLEDIVEEFRDIYKSRSHFIRACIEDWNFRKIRKNGKTHKEREEFLSDTYRTYDLEWSSRYAENSAKEMSREIEDLLSSVESIRLLKTALEMMNNTLMDLQKTRIFNPRNNRVNRVGNNSSLRKYMEEKKEYPNREEYSPGPIPTDDF